MGISKFADRILEESSVHGGLIVVLGLDDPSGGELIAALGRSGRFLVQGLDVDEARVAEARDAIESVGDYNQLPEYYRWTTPMATTIQTNWREEVPLLVRAIVLAGDTLFLALSTASGMMAAEIRLPVNANHTPATQIAGHSADAKRRPIRMSGTALAAGWR